MQQGREKTADSGIRRTSGWDFDSEQAGVFVTRADMLLVVFANDHLSHDVRFDAEAECSTKHHITSLLSTVLYPQVLSYFDKDHQSCSSTGLFCPQSAMNICYQRLAGRHLAFPWDRVCSNLGRLTSRQSRQCISMPDLWMRGAGQLAIYLTTSTSSSLSF